MVTVDVGKGEEVWLLILQLLDMYTI
jgi:hypothetical protein